MSEISFVDDGKEILEDIQKKIGKKGVVILLGGIGVVGLFLAYKSFNKQKSTNELVSATGYIGYPEAEENADVIISELTEEVTSSGSSIMSMFEQYQSNVLGELEELRQETNKKFENIEQINGDNINKYNSSLTNGSVGGEFMNTDKGNIKDTTKDEITKEATGKTSYKKEVTPKWSGDTKKFADFRDEVSGKTTYTQKFSTNESGKVTAGKVTASRDWKTNEYGGKTVVGKLGDTVTITKLNAQGEKVETEKKNIKDL